MEFQKQFLQFVQNTARSEGGENDCEEETSFEEDEMPQIQREVWSDEEVKGMPVLQRMDGLSPGGSRKVQSPAPPALPLSAPEVRLNKKERSVRLNNIVEGEIVMKDSLPCSKLSSEKYESDSQKLNDVGPCKKSVDLSMEANFIDSVKQPTQESSDRILVFEKKNSEIDRMSVLCLSHDTPMEPDSTSEFLLCAARQRKEREIIIRNEISPCSEVSPRSTACIGHGSTLGVNNGSINSGEVTVRLEESQAECDSTCMFLTSSSAISPASQSEIEERVCPVLTDHEDGASPAHNCIHVQMCRYRTLPTPSDLVTREHVQILSPVSTSADKDHTKDNKKISSKSQPEWNPLVRATNNQNEECKESTCVPTHTQPVCESQIDPCKSENKLSESAPKIDKVPPNCNLKAESKRNSSLSAGINVPHVEDFLGEKYEGKKCSMEVESIKSNGDVPKATEPVTASTLTVQSIESKHSSSKNSDCCSSLGISEKLDGVSPLKISNGKSVSSRKQHSPVCDFSPIDNIDWRSAVAETVESPKSLSTHNGESKPGIILKIRTKSIIPKSSVAQMIEHTSMASAQSTSVALSENLAVTETTVNRASFDRKRHTVDSPEIVSRLRKREKIPKVQQNQPEPVQKSQQQQSRDSKGKKRPTSQIKRKRRHTVQLGNLASNVEHLPAFDRQFAKASIRLYQLQKHTHDLLSSLSPHLHSKLSSIMPDSSAFLSMIDDTIAALELSEPDNLVMDLEGICTSFESLKLESAMAVPVYLPRVTLCRSPQHAAEEFQDKVCCLLQLMLPSVSMSFRESLCKGDDDLVAFIQWIQQANKPQK